MNSLTVCGNVGKVTTHNTSDGKKVVAFSVATDDSYTDKKGERIKRTDWHDCVAFQYGEKPGLAGMLSENLKKGDSVLCVGPMKKNTYRKSGEDSDRVQLQLHVDHFEWVGRKQSNGDTDAETGPADDIPPMTDEEIAAMTNQHRGME